MMGSEVDVFDGHLQEERRSQPAALQTAMSGYLLRRVMFLTGREEATPFGQGHVDVRCSPARGRKSGKHHGIFGAHLRERTKDQRPRTCNTNE